MNEFLNFTLIEIGKYKFSVLSVILILLAIIATRVFLFLFKNIVLRKIVARRMESSRLTSIYQIFSYISWIFCFSIILQIIHIKLTFLLAGSAALMVGIGLGLQQVFSDFISGIIILFDGSIKVNDVMEVDGLVGRIEAINLRTSNLYTRNGYSIIVPNHKFIHENVINWTHNNQASRFNILVGVGYKSDVDLVKNILLDCAKLNDKVITDKKQSSAARLIRFGESTLDFELVFWSNEAFSIENIKSDIRYAILKKFRENNISISFPQRDVHIIKTENSSSNSDLI